MGKGSKDGKVNQEWAGQGVFGVPGDAQGKTGQHMRKLCRGTHIHPRARPWEEKESSALGRANSGRPS